MSDIEFKEGAVCFADGAQWVNEYEHLRRDALITASYGWVHKKGDFQLNTIKQGDYIEVSELNTEQEYNDAVEVFGLFRFEFKGCAVSEYKHLNHAEFISCCEDGLWKTSTDKWNKRKITFNQLMAIGELKRLELKRDNEPKFGKNEDGSMKLVKSNFSERPNSCKDGDKYHREIIGLDGTKTTVDVYRILDAFKTDCSATDHAVKKMLCAGLRGHKDKLTDYDNAIESLQAAKELLMQKSNNENTN